MGRTLSASHIPYSALKPYLFLRPSSYVARLEMQFSLGHSWQLVKATSVGKMIPEIDFLGIIRKSLVNLTPIIDSTSPRIENRGFCCVTDQSSCPGPILDIFPSPFFSARYFPKYVLADLSAKSPTVRETIVSECSRA